MIVIAYFFDIENGSFTVDDTGLEVPGPMDARREAFRALPAIAADEIPMDGDRRHFTVLVRDEAGLPVYSATLSFVGMGLVRPAPQAEAE